MLGEHAARLMYACHHRRTDTIFVLIIGAAGWPRERGCLCLTGGGVYVFTFNHVLRRESVGLAG